MDWSGLFGFEAGPVEMFVRGTVIYWFLFGLLRIAGRRDVGSMGVADLLVLVLVADAAGNAMAGESYSLSDGMAVVATIVFWSVAIDRIGYFSPTLRRWLEPRRVCLIKDGELQLRGMRREYITRGELMEALRLAGVSSVSMVRRAYMEANGEISVLKSDAPGDAKRPGTVEGLPGEKDDTAGRD